jgi:hypothetical protein
LQHQGSSFRTKPVKLKKNRLLEDHRNSDCQTAIDFDGKRDIPIFTNLSDPRHLTNPYKTTKQMRALREIYSE